ncbi:MAG: PLP-dependent cysteine synthase family protein [Oscillospiraceae bacterium]|nr:PLP-dependent cysteine synthase family protein [Oscillospiraceae bacterium]
MDNSKMTAFESLKNMSGNTPLLEISFTYKEQPRKIYAKAEYFNYTGSIKDRVAYYIMKKAYETGSIKEGDVVAEATSGNTGIAFSAISTYLGHKAVIFMPDWMSRERINLMKSFGAEVRLVSREEGGFLGSIDLCRKLAENGGVFLPEQFSNEDNCDAHYYLTGDEISRQLDSFGLKADAVVAGVGTGGTVMGIGRRLKDDNPSVEIYPLEPLNSPTLSTGYKVGNHRIQGISDEFIPDILKLDKCGKVVSVDDIDSVIMAQRLSRELGLGVGISSGANFLGSVIAGDRLGNDAVITTVFADDNKKYLSTDYSNEFTPAPDSISSQIKLLGFRAVR